MENIIAKVSAYHVPHEIGMLSAAVRAGGVVFISVHNMTAFALDDRV